MRQADVCDQSLPVREKVPSTTRIALRSKLLYRAISCSGLSDISGTDGRHRIV